MTRWPRGRQPYQKDRSTILGVVGGDRAAMRFDQMAHDREAETEAANGSRRQRSATAERLEDVRQKVRVDSRSRIPDRDLQIGRPVFRGDFDTATCRRELH